MKKINAMVMLIICIINITVFPYASAAEVSRENIENPYAEKQELLIALNLMSNNSEGEIDNSKEISRAEFAGIAAKFLNVNPTVVASSSYFYDVPVEDWYTNSLNALIDYGIIDQNEDKMFYPDSTISLDEATKIIVCLLGYRMFAMQKGGYPLGYNAAAANLGLLKQMPGGTKLTNAHMTVLLYNAVSADSKAPDTTVDGLKIEQKSDNILAKRDIYKADGVVESVYGLSIYGKEVSNRADVLIDNVIYKTDEYEKISEYFGKRVRFYYKKEADDKFALLYFEPYYHDDDIVEVLSEDFESYEQSSNLITYISAGKSKRALLSSNAVVLRNGAIVDSNVSDAFNITNGEIKLIDSNNDKKYDICCIYDFKTVVANNVNIENRELTYKLISDPTTPEERQNYNGFFDFSENNVDYLTVYSSVGTVVDFAAITQNAVLDVAVSDDNKYVTIYINSEIIESTLKGFSGSEETISLENGDYHFYSCVLDIYNLKIHDSGKFKLNKYGKISYFEKTAKTGETNPAVYIVNVTKDSEDEEMCWVKYFDSTGTFLTKLTSDNIRLDGETLDTDDIYTKLSKLKRTIAVLSLNSKDEITKIDSPNKSYAEDDSTLKTLINYDGVGSKWNSATKMFGRNVVCSSDAVVFVVPPILPEYEDFAYDEQSYSIGTLSDFISNEFNNVDCYKFGSSFYCNIVVLYKYKYQNPFRNRFMMVTGVSDVLAANEERATRITGYQNGELVSYDVSDKYKVGTAADCDIVIGKGDIITVGAKDNDGLVGNVEVHFDFSRNWSGLNQICIGGYMFDSYANRNYDALYYWINTFTDLQSYTRFIAGCPVEVDGNLIKFVYPDVDGGRDSGGAYKWRRWHLPTEFDSCDEVAILKSTTPIIVYDVSSKSITKGSVVDICTADTYDCPSQVFFDMRWGEAVSIFVINNNYDAWNKSDIIE